MTFTTILFVLAAITLGTVSVLLLHSLIRAYRSPANYQEVSQRLPTNIVLEAFWTIVPFGILAALLVLTAQAL